MAAQRSANSEKVAAMLQDEHARAQRHEERAEKRFYKEATRRRETLDAQAKGAREAKAAKAAAKKPRAPSAYNLYMKEQLAGDAIDKALPHSERFKLVGEGWKALSEDDRAVYAAESERLKAEITKAAGGGAE